MKCKPINFLILSLCFPVLVFSQISLFEPQPVTEAIINDTLITAFSGGEPEINWPRLALADIDNDNNLELFVGTASGRLSLYRFNGYQYHCKYHLETTFYDSIDVGVNATPAFYDIDNDGDLDLFVSNGSNGGNGGNVSYFENIGDAWNAEWLLQEDTLAGLDAWDHATVTVGDIDGDNDGDLLVGGGYGNLYYSENIGTPDSAIWADPIEDYADIFVGYKATPTLCDINCDGKLDLIIGNDKGKTYYYQNKGIINGEINWDLITETLIGVDFTHLDYTHAVCGDINQDGYVDILVSEHYGNINLFENTAGCVPKWEWITGDLLSGTIDVGKYSFPALVDIDEDCDFDMFIGKANGQIRFCMNEGNDSVPHWNLVAEQFLDFDTGGTGTNSSKPFFFDFDYDGDPDLFIGQNKSPGKVWYYKNVSDSLEVMFELESADFFSGFTFSGYAIPVLEDFNQDSLVDFAYIKFSNTVEDSIVMVLNSGLTTPWDMSETVSIPAGQITRFRAIDFDYDGDVDFVLKGKYPMSGFWLLQNQTESIGWQMINLSPSLPTGNNFTIVDFDNDFDWDLFSGTNNGGIKFWENNTHLTNFGWKREGLTFTFQDSSLVGASEWFWEFGDGNFSSDQNPQHNYTMIDTFEVCLTISQHCKESKICKLVGVCVPPLSNFNFEVDELTVAFQDSSQWSNIIGWTLSDGNSYSGDSFIHTFAEPGDYEVCQIVENECGADTLCVEVSILVSVKTIPGKMMEIFLFPDPAITNIQVFIKGFQGPYKINLYNSLGEFIHQYQFVKTSSNESVVIPVSDLTSGIYLLELEYGRYSRVKKFVVN